MTRGTALCILLAATVTAFTATNQVAKLQPADEGLDFIDTSFENASPVWYERDGDGTLQIHLLYDHER